MSKGELVVGCTVQVDFISDSRTEYSDAHIFGTGVIDVVEDGYVMGRLDSGQTFMCPVQYVVVK